MHHGVNICKVNIDISVQGNDFSHSLHRGLYDVVGKFESLPGREVSINGVEPLIAYDQHAVGIFAEFHNSLQRLVVSFLTFGRRGDCDDGDGQDSQFTGKFGNYGSSSGTGTASHPGGNEQHFCVLLQHFPDFIIIFTCSFFAHFWSVPGSPAFGKGCAQLYFNGYGAVGQCLGIGIAHDVVNPFNP